MSTSPTILPSDFPLPSSPSLKQHEPLLPASVSSRIPLRYREKLATIPRNAWLIIGFLITLNIVVWVVVIIVLVSVSGSFLCSFLGGVFRSVLFCFVLFCFVFLQFCDLSVPEAGGIYLPGHKQMSSQPPFGIFDTLVPTENRIQCP